MNTFRTWKVAVLALALVAALGWTATPASSHVKGWGHTWTKHLQPKADKRYYTKALSDARYWTKAAADQRYVDATLPRGTSMSGIWSAAGATGELALETIEFPSRVEGTVTGVFATALSANCPGAGQAAVGYLCVYPNWQNSMTFASFLDPNSSGGGIRPEGTILYMTSSQQFGNSRGTWTVTAPTSAARVPSKMPAPRRSPATH